MILMRKTLSTYAPLFLLCFLTSCLVKQDPEPTHSELMVTRGDLVVTSYTNDSLVSFKENGSFKKVLYQLPNAADNITTITWLPQTNEILMAIEGTPDRVDAYSVVTGTVRNFYINTTYLTGTIMGITQLKNSGDVLVSESTTIERFSNNGTRETWATIWPSNVHTANQQLVGLSTGNWLSCTTALGVRVYPDSTTAMAVVSSVTSAIAATTMASGCGELSDGRIVVGWNGTSDALQVYSATLTGVATMFANNPSVLSDPRGIAIGENDEIYVADGTRNVVVEINPATNEKVREFGNQYLQSPRSILVIPEIN